VNPIKNKKDLETTINEIRNFAYAYLEKYSPSKQQLRIYLFKKFLIKNQKISNKKELFNLIDAVISTLEDQKLISDKYYSDAKTKDFLAASTAAFVSAVSPSEIKANASSLEGLITSKSLETSGLTHWPLI